MTIGLAAPFARPARAAVTLAAVGLGAIAVTFAVGLSSSLNMVADGLSHAQSEPVQVYPGRDRAARQHSARASSRSRSVGAASGPSRRRCGRSRARCATPRRPTSRVSVAGLSGQVRLTAFRGDAGWTGYDMISGHWYSGPGQVDVPTNFLTVTGKAVGDTVTFSDGGAQVTARIVGEVFDTDNRGLAMLTDWRTLAAAEPRPHRRRV